MYVQPLLLTTPLSQAAPVARSFAVNRGNEQDAVAPSSAAGSDTADELDISAEAERQLKASENQTPASFQLTEEEQTQVRELKTRDREVRTHEQAHLAAAGGYAKGGPTFSYQQGPDGKRYAIGGEVQIDTSPIPGDPNATLQKARVIRAAASAPAEPSGQDRAVAAQATQMEATARAELLQQQQDAGGKNSTKVVNAGRFQPTSSRNADFDSEGDSESDSNERLETDDRPTINLLA